MCYLLNYKSKVTVNAKRDYEYLYILKSGLNNLWKDYNELKIKFPEINLGYKGERIKQNLKIYARKIQRIPGNSSIILDILSKKDYTVNEIAKIIHMTRQGVRYHIHNLEKQNKIKKIGIKGGKNYIYSLISR